MHEFLVATLVVLDFRFNVCPFVNNPVISVNLKSNLFYEFPHIDG